MDPKDAQTPPPSTDQSAMPAPAASPAPAPPANPMPDVGSSMPGTDAPKPVMPDPAMGGAKKGKSMGMVIALVVVIVLAAVAYFMVKK